MDKRRILLGIFLIAIIIASTTLIRYYERMPYVMLSTTTSFDATGFLSFLNEYLKDRYHLELRRTAVGTGMALLIADRGDSDACIVHAPSLEREFRNNGTFALRKVLAYNFFIIVGPSDDPANVSSARDAIEAFYRILLYGESSGSKAFVSRYDNSGTHIKEKYLWNLVIERYNLSLSYEDIASKSRYVKAGSGMAETLMMADQFGAYTLSDIGTYLYQKKNAGLHLEMLFAGDYYTLNVYSIMVVKNAKHFDNAKRLAEFLASDEGQKLFGEYGVSDFGHPLFYPARPLLEAYKAGELHPGTYNYVPPELKHLVDDYTLAKRIFEYAFRDINGDNQPDWESGWRWNLGYRFSSAPCLYRSPPRS